MHVYRRQSLATPKVNEASDGSIHCLKQLFSTSIYFIFVSERSDSNLQWLNCKCQTAWTERLNKPLVRLTLASSPDAGLVQRDFNLHSVCSSQGKTVTKVSTWLGHQRHKYILRDGRSFTSHQLQPTTDRFPGRRPLRSSNDLYDPRGGDEWSETEKTDRPTFG